MAHSLRHSRIFWSPVWLKVEKPRFLSLYWKLYLERNFWCLKWFRRQHEIYSTLWRCFFWTLSRLNRNFCTWNFFDLWKSRWLRENFCYSYKICHVTLCWVRLVQPDLELGHFHQELVTIDPHGDVSSDYYSLKN